MRKPIISFSLLLPGLLAIILFMPYTMNFLAHAWFGEKQFNSLVMTKLPVDGSVINLPAEVKQYEPFTATLQLDTDKLAQRINRLVDKSPAGLSIQHIEGRVYPEMQAEMTTAMLSFEPKGPQSQLYTSHSETSWMWTVTPNESGRHTVLIKLHLQTKNSGQAGKKVADLAEIQVFVQKNPAEWMRRYGIWYIAIILIVMTVWWKYRRTKR
ncbi:MAG: hypothetical protein RQ714_08560 [Nitrosomonas sp.]|nr:hypothetical protein [Nitrosomonas sp.]